MAVIRSDMVHEVSVTTGTGPFALAAALQGPYRRFSAVCSVNDIVPYMARNRDVPSEWEVGYGTYSATNELTRTLVYDGSNGAAAVNFSAGTKDVVLVFHAAEVGRVGYVLPFHSQNHAAPADATTYYVSIGAPAGTVAGDQRSYFPASGRVRRALVGALVAGTLGTAAQNCTVSLRIDNTTDHQITTALPCSARQNYIAITTLDVAVTQLSTFWEIKILTPTWTTNPTNVVWTGLLWVV
jgi:hypothetical protein